MIQQLSIKTIVAVILALALVAGFGYWIYWTAGAVSTITELNGKVAAHESTIKELRADIEDYTETKRKLDEGFSLIETDQLDLICAARVKPEPIIVPDEPKIVEVVKYIDSKTKCPTTDPSKAEPYDPSTAVLRPTNEAISLKTLNNAWKAYCLAINNEAEQCAPFR